MLEHGTFVTELLRRYHDGESADEEQILELDFDRAHYLCDVGLGPIAHLTFGDALGRVAPDLLTIFKSADLTTRVLYSQLENATVKILQHMNAIGITPTLLKGISTSQQFYSPPHLRLMGDVDLLVGPDEADQTMALLAELGYETAEEEWIKYRAEPHHHLPEAIDPDTGVNVEVHTGLIVPNDPLATTPLFQADNLEKQKSGFDYKGQAANRFSPEFQLVHSLSHWAVDGKWATNLTGINDVIHIVRSKDYVLDWATTIRWLELDPRLLASSTAILRYLAQAKVIELPPDLETTAGHFKPAAITRTNRLQASLIHNYPFNAKVKDHDEHAQTRARLLWLALTKPTRSDAGIALAYFRVICRCIHHGRFNPLGWLLRLFRTAST